MLLIVARGTTARIGAFGRTLGHCRDGAFVRAAVVTGGTPIHGQRRVTLLPGGALVASAALQTGVAVGERRTRVAVLLGGQIAAGKFVIDTVTVLATGKQLPCGHRLVAVWALMAVLTGSLRNRLIADKSAVFIRFVSMAGLAGNLCM